MPETILKYFYTVVGNKVEKSYLMLNLYTSAFRVHQISALVFLSKNAGINYVHHRNGITWDNRRANLKWVTLTENLGYKLGLPIQVLEDCEGSIKTTEFTTQSDAFAAYDIQFEVFNTCVHDRRFEHEGKRILVKK